MTKLSMFDKMVSVPLPEQYPLYKPLLLATKLLTDQEFWSEFMNRCHRLPSKIGSKRGLRLCLIRLYTYEFKRRQRIQRRMEWEQRELIILYGDPNASKPVYGYMNFPRENV